MTKTVFHICKFLLVTIALPLAPLAQTAAGNGKKIYADYHGVRYSREHDGKLGRWSYYKEITKSKTSTKLLAYNADNILENGLHEIAAVNYPMAGLQSDLDPDYIEYQILTAKAAKIDGFFIEWGFPEHESNAHLKAFQQVAAKYNFEIGVNWCDGWLYYDWITKLRPDIKTREDKTKHFKYCLQYLVDSVFAVSTAPLIKGIPVYYWFGGGITNEEYKQTVIGNIKEPEKVKMPVALRRHLLTPDLINDKYTPPSANEEFKKWTILGTSPTAWIPLRIRSSEKLYPAYDFYGTEEDAVNYMNSYKDVWYDSVNYNVALKSGFVVPGMDNRGCAGWGHDVFYSIPRNEGRYYESFWKYNLASKDKLDMIFIASWSDLTEGHEIQPTIENGYRELKTTLKYAAEFKNEPYSSKGLELPLQLFELRKKCSFLIKAGVVVDLVSELNTIAQLISNGDYDAATGLLQKAKKHFIQLERSKLTSKTIKIDKDVLVNNEKQGKNCYDNRDSLLISVPKEIKSQLQKSYYTGYINFDYLDAGVLNEVNLYSSTQKTDKAFSIVGQIKTANTGEWKKAKIQLIHSNIKQSAAGTFYFKIKGGVTVKNIRMEFVSYEKR